ncbi:hypothetical protein DFJ74DRAFT_765847 [Hyaloraphidium curvatum]|nr:hypothetical protein DFJ74DRAFT_765847 [Hyaloraphidium curvatum]
MVELHSWGPGPDNLPSFDPFCLSAEVRIALRSLDAWDTDPLPSSSLGQIILNISGIRWTPNDCNDTRISPTGRLPVLQDGPTVVTGTLGIVDYARKKGTDIDADLDAMQRVDSLAYIAMVEDTLHEALLFSWWLEPDNYARHASPTYSRAMPLLTRYTGPQRIRDGVRKRLRDYEGSGAAPAAQAPEGAEASGPPSSRGARSEIYAVADRCYRALSLKLGNRNFFLSDKPTSLDAVVLGHLLLHLLPLPNPTLRDLLSRHSNLVAFCRRFRPLAFANHPHPSPPKPWLSSLPNPLRILDPAAWKAWVPSGDALGKAGGVAAVLALFVAYIVSNGIVQIGTDSDDDGFPPPPPPVLMEVDPADIPSPVDDDTGAFEVFEEYEARDEDLEQEYAEDEDR